MQFEVVNLKNIISSNGHGSNMHETLLLEAKPQVLAIEVSTINYFYDHFQINKSFASD